MKLTTLSWANYCFSTRLEQNRNAFCSRSWINGAKGEKIWTLSLKDCGNFPFHNHYILLTGERKVISFLSSLNFKKKKKKVDRSQRQYLLKKNFMKKSMMTFPFFLPQFDLLNLRTWNNVERTNDIIWSDDPHFTHKLISSFLLPQTLLGQKWNWDGKKLSGCQKVFSVIFQIYAPLN